MIRENALRQAQGERNGRIRVPIHFREDLFHMLRRRAEREGTSIGEVTEDILRRALGG